MIHPVILCGGSGTRLWPLSRKDYPKQFSPIFGGESLFQASLRRYAGPGFAPPMVLSHSDFRFLVAEQLAGVGHPVGTEDGAEILLEPAARNTGPAILCAALRLAERAGEDAVMVVAPSDHVIRDVPAFLAAVEAGAEAAGQGRLVTLGSTPDRAETGYGYLELDAVPEAGAAPAALPVRRFVEKPDAQAAAEMLASGR